MKRGIYFDDQNKKKFIIILIFGLCIYLLYFNDRILIQDIIQKSLSNNESNITENFNIQKYTDICKNRKTNFYNFRSTTNSVPSVQNLLEDQSTATVKTIDDCEQACDNTPNCYAFFMDDTTPPPVCSLYKGNLRDDGKDNNIMDISVNCDTGRELKDELGRIPTYVGYGFINNKYYKDNKDNFKYIDTGLIASGKLIGYLKNMRSELDKPAPERTQTAINTAGGHIRTWITDYKAMTGITEDNWGDSGTGGTINFFDQRFISTNHPANTQLIDLHKYTQETRNLDNKLKDSDKSGSTNQIFYIILAFVMVFTIILLVLYKFNNNAIINDRFMIFYFIVIVCIFSFIHFILNI